jgi:hypothetical protein
VGALGAYEICGSSCIKWKPWNGQTLDYFMKTPPKKKKFGSIFKIRSFSMDLEALIPIDLPKKVIYRRR